MGYSTASPVGGGGLRGEARQQSAGNHPSRGTYVTGDSLTSMLTSIMSEEGSFTNMAYDAMTPMGTSRRVKEDHEERLMKK